MTIYEHKTSLTTASGTIGTISLKVPGGLLKYVLVRANTDTTVFRFKLTDDNSRVRLNYGFHQGELVDDKISMPITGAYTASITNASPDDTFDVVLAIQEN